MLPAESCFLLNRENKYVLNCNEGSCQGLLESVLSCFEDVIICMRMFYLLEWGGGGGAARSDGGLWQYRASRGWWLPIDYRLCHLRDLWTTDLWMTPEGFLHHQVPPVSAQPTTLWNETGDFITIKMLNLLHCCPVESWEKNILDWLFIHDNQLERRRVSYSFHRSYKSKQLCLRNLFPSKNIERTLT